jgi:hypothetical protein
MTKYLTVAEVMEILKTAPPDAYIRLEHEPDPDGDRECYWITDEFAGFQKGGQQSPLGRDVPVIRFRVEEF